MGNASKRWEALLADMLDIELLAANSASIVEKLFDDEDLDEPVCKEYIFV